MVSNLRLSHNGRYIMYENTLYDIATDTTFSMDSTDIGFWITFLKENSEQSYKNSLTKYSDIQKLIRETSYHISNFFTGIEKDTFLFEFESKYSNKLITEDTNLEVNLDKLNSSWDFIIGKLNTIKEQSTLSKIGGKISSGIDWVKEKGIDWFFEGLRDALQSWGGAAVQTFLATYGAAVGGNVVLVVVWGAMLAYDIYKGTQGNWDWTNIIIDLLGVVTTGPGAKVMGNLFKRLGIMGKNLPLKEIITKLGTTKMGSWFVKIINLIASKTSTIIKWVSSGINWLSSKLGIKNLTKYTSNITSRVSPIIDEISSVTSKTIKPQINKVTQVGKSTVGQVKQGLKNVGSKIGDATSTRLGQVATSAGMTYGANKVLGGSTEVLGGAFQNNSNDDIIKLLVSKPIKYDPNMWP
jgi:hypothetical protein